MLLAGEASSERAEHCAPAAAAFTFLLLVARKSENILTSRWMRNCARTTQAQMGELGLGTVLLLLLCVAQA